MALRKTLKLRRYRKARGCPTCLSVNEQPTKMKVSIQPLSASIEPMKGFRLLYSHLDESGIAQIQEYVAKIHREYPGWVTRVLSGEKENELELRVLSAELAPLELVAGTKTRYGI